MDANQNIIHSIIIIIIIKHYYYYFIYIVCLSLIYEHIS